MDINIHFGANSSMTPLDWLLTIIIGLLTGSISGIIVGKILSHNEQKIRKATSLWNLLFEAKNNALTFS